MGADFQRSDDRSRPVQPVGVSQCGCRIDRAPLALGNRQEPRQTVGHLIDWINHIGILIVAEQLIGGEYSHGIGVRPVQHARAVLLEYFQFMEIPVNYM